MTTTTCQFNFPRTWENKPPTSKTDLWNYSEITCYSEDNGFVSPTQNPEDIYTLIQNSETGAEFYIEKTLTYGEALILWFLTMFSFYLIFKVAYNFFWKK